jgi:phenylpyruvate tautomerase PptA (4-oxalocrotonate tautomerase family)
MDDCKITVKFTAPYKTFAEAQEVSKKVTEAIKELAKHPGKNVKVIFVKVEE